MPKWDYKCEKCDVIEEHRVDKYDTKVYCTCGAEMNQQFPMTGNFVLKGTGWERDGYYKPSKQGQIRPEGQIAGKDY